MRTKWFLLFVIFISQKLHRTEGAFSCEGRASGYYADIDSGCQVYHMCDGLGRQFSYSCPNTTLFQQRMLICDHWYMVNCSKSELDYNANLLIGQRDKPFVDDSSENPYHRTPRPDLETHPYAPQFQSDYRQGKAQFGSTHNLIGAPVDNENSTDGPQYFLPSHWSTHYSKDGTTPLPPVKKLSKIPEKVRGDIKKNKNQGIKQIDKNNIQIPSKFTLPPFQTGGNIQDVDRNQFPNGNRNQDANRYEDNTQFPNTNNFQDQRNFQNRGNSQSEGNFQDRPSFSTTENSNIVSQKVTRTTNEGVFLGFDQNPTPRIPKLPSVIPNIPDIPLNIPNGPFRSLLPPKFDQPRPKLEQRLREFEEPIVIIPAKGAEVLKPKQPRRQEGDFKLSKITPPNPKVVPQTVRTDSQIPRTDSQIPRRDQQTSRDSQFQRNDLLTARSGSQIPRDSTTFSRDETQTSRDDSQIANSFKSPQPAILTSTLSTTFSTFPTISTLPAFSKPSFSNPPSSLSNPPSDQTTNEIEPPSIFYQPPKLTPYVDPESTTMDPIAFYKLVPSKELQPPIQSKSDDSATTDSTTTARSVTKKDTSSDTSTNNQEYSEKRLKELRQIFFIPEYDFPLDLNSRPGYDSGVSSFQVKPDSTNPEIKKDDKCDPKCDPKFLVPGTCKPCVMIRR